jgi:hypothetical protein
MNAKKISTWVFGCVCFIAMQSLFADFQNSPKVISVQDLQSADLDIISESEGKGVIFMFPEGTLLPLQCSLNGGLASLTDPSALIGELEVKETFYVQYLEDDKLLLSQDLQEWKSYAEFFTGNLSIGISLQEGKPILSINLEANRRL